MRITELSLRRPITTIMIFMGMVLLGIISWIKLPQELFPSISYPEITVVTSYKNAAPEEIENLVTKQIEEAVGTVNNVKRIKSISREGLSLVIIDFNWNTNMDFAALAVREKIDLIKEKLPREAEEPIVMKYNPFDLPVMNLAVTGNVPPVELREIARKYIKDAIEKIDGVASATITGGDEKEILVEIDQGRLRASDISIVTIVNTLKKANIDYPAGTVKESVYEYLIRTMGKFKTLKDIEETPAAIELPPEEKTPEEKKKDVGKQRRLIYLKDIATIRETLKERTSISRYNGKDSVSLAIRKQSGANTTAVAHRIRQEIKKLLAEKIPKGINIQVTYDQSEFITDALTNLRNSAIQGGILAFFVLFIFLRNIRPAITIIISIPISLMATFFLMYCLKINVNIMSLGGLTLAVGMLVDNSIVVIENIFRRRREISDPIKACAEGTNEVFAPVMGSTLTTVSVFLPFAFVVGIAGQIFKQLSLTIVSALLLSVLVAIILVPVILSLKSQQKTPYLPSSFSERFTDRFTLWLRKLIPYRYLIILVVLGLFGISLYYLIHFHHKRFLPEFDQRQFIIKVELRPGTRLKETDKLVRVLENMLFQVPEVKEVTVNIGSSTEHKEEQATSVKALGSHQAQIMVNLYKRKEKKGIGRSTKDVIALLKEKTEADPRFKQAQLEFIAQETSLGRSVGGTAPVAIEVRGPQLSTIAEMSSFLKEELEKIPGLYGIKTSLTPPTPETKINVLKDKASFYGLSVSDIAITAQVALKGYTATKFKVKGEDKDIDITVRLRQQDRANVNNLKHLLIRSPMRMMVPLSEVAYIVTGTGPTEIQRIDQQRTVIVSANILHRAFDEVIADVKKAIDNLQSAFPESREYTIELAGEHEEMQESFKSLAFALALAILLVYMIMAAEFESLWQPFIIMFTVPLSIIGVALILLVTRTPLSVVAYLGIIMLGGIVVNNGIVLVDFIGGLRKEGYSLREAAIRAAAVRLRPILMTSLTTILGMLPLAMGLGEGAELRTPLARTVIGGLLTSTFLTLVVIPFTYIIATEYLLALIRTFQKIKGVFVTPKTSLTPSTEETAPSSPAEKIPSSVQEPTSPVKEIPEDTEPVTQTSAPLPIVEDKPLTKEKVLPVSSEESFKEKQEHRETPHPSAPEEKAPAEKPKESIEIPSQKQETSEDVVSSHPEEKEKKESINTNEPTDILDTLLPRQRKLIEILKERKKISRAEYAKMLGISTPTAARDLKALTKKGIIIGKGPLGPGRWYELTPDYQ